MHQPSDGLGTRTSLRLGFFSVLPLGEGGYIGGYLVLNGVGRPLEFHCTSPVRPTKAQEILYGPTLRPYLFGEQMAPALIAKTRAPVHAIFVSEWESLALAPTVEQPVAVVLRSDISSNKMATCNCRDNGAGHVGPDSAFSTIFEPSRATQQVLLEQAVIPESQPLTIGPNRLLVALNAEDSLFRLQQLLHPWAEHFDLTEPFERIRAALEEALRRG